MIAHSLLQVLGDRSFKYKYTNPNLLFVAVSSAADADLVEKQSVSVMLVNTVTGGVLHQQTHSGASGPVEALASEHWFVYTLVDRQSMRQQVGAGGKEGGGQEQGRTGATRDWGCCGFVTLDCIYLE